MTCPSVVGLEDFGGCRDAFVETYRLWKDWIAVIAVFVIGAKVSRFGSTLMLSLFTYAIPLTC